MSPLMTPAEWAAWDADAKTTRLALDIAVGRWEKAHQDASLLLFEAKQALDKARADYEAVTARARPREYDAKE